MIIDTFIFNRDFAALEIRLNELKNIVDYFIVSESAFTHSGIPKPLYLSESPESIAKFQDKVILISDKKNHRTSNPRVREMIQRQNITKHLRKMNLNGDDIIFHSDCDEIPRASILQTLGKNVNSIFEFSNYSNFLNLNCGIWARGRAVSYSRFKSIQHMRQDIFIEKAFPQKRNPIPFLYVPDFWTTRKYFLWKFPQLVRDPKMTYITDAGWHFNNLIPESQIIEKIQSSCHTELDTDVVRTQALSNYRSGREIYTGEELNFVEIDHSYPSYVLNNLDRFHNYIFRRLTS
jgi:beta-1,4-mannosyl-glycoprotein beta-1,4-N-acetylglucosaminyltransferase